MDLHHPAANLFPMMGDEEFAALKADIVQNGLIEPIWFYNGQILDGRNRWRACTELGITPEVKEYTGKDPIGFVVSLNLKRRHLTSSQKSIVALDIEAMLAVEAKQRISEAGRLGGEAYSPIEGRKGREIFPYPSSDTGKAVDQAAAMVGTNGRYVQDAKKIKQEAPELIPQIAAGELSIPEAKREVKKRQQEQRIKEQLIQPDTTAATVQVYHGNCFDVIPTIPDKSISAAVIDPPYNVTEFDWDKFGSAAEFMDFTKKWLDAIKGKFADNYHLFIFCDASYAADIEMMLRADSWPIKSRIVWEYRNLVMGRDTADRFIQNWQMCFHVGYGKLNWSPVWDDSRFAVQQFATPQSNFAEGKYHPHQKPMGLIENLVKAGSGYRDTVLDIFAGSGTTGIAAVKNGRNAILIEQSDEYCSIIENRLGVKRVAQ